MIHATAVVADDAELGTGTSVGPYAVVGVDGDPDTGPLTLGDAAIVRSHAVLYRGSRMGARFHIGHHALVRDGAEIGDDVSVGSDSVIEHHVRMGHGVRLHSRCFVPEYSVLEDGAWLGPGVILTNARYPNRPDTKVHLTPVTVERGAAVGAGAVVLPGVRVGAGALVGAGAVVVHDVAPRTTVVGNPARVVG